MKARALAQRAGDEVVLVEGLQRVVGEHVVAHGRGGGAVERVEQLAERHRRRSLGPGVLAAAGVGDDELVGRRDDRVEEQLAVLGAQVALAGAGPPRQHVVAVDGRHPREHPVVEADQAHHPVRHRAHRHHRADRQRPGAEVGARRAPAQPLLQERAYVGLAQRGAGVAGARGDARDLAVELRDLPDVLERGRAVRPWTASVRAVVQSVTLIARSARRDEGVDAVDELGEAPDEVEVAVAHVVDRARCRTTCRWSSPDIAAPSSTRRSPATQVLASSPVRPKVPRCSAS